MVHNSYPRRDGVSLMEVLAAIFISGIGLLSLLTLFPLGALKMAEAIKDERTAYAGENALALANAPYSNLRGLRGDPNVLNCMLGNEGYPTQGFPAITSGYPGPGYCVLVDPIGYSSAFASNSTWQQWVAGSPVQPVINPVTGQAQQQVLTPGGLPSGIPRRTVSWLPLGVDNPSLTRWCTLLDDMTFDFDGPNAGAPNISNSGSIQRQGRYSWAWFCRMPQATQPSVVELCVLVFSGRSLNFTGLDTMEQSYAAVFSPTDNVVSITLAPGQDRPFIRRGGWILDSTMLDASSQSYAPRGYFYRVVSITDTSPTTFDIEVQTPLRAVAQGQPGTIVIFENLVEVFDYKKRT
jgi:hypothetical protein